MTTAVLHGPQDLSIEKQPIDMKSPGPVSRRVKFTAGVNFLWQVS